MMKNRTTMKRLVHDHFDSPAMEDSPREQLEDFGSSFIVHWLLVPEDDFPRLVIFEGLDSFFCWFSSHSCWIFSLISSKDFFLFSRGACGDGSLGLLVELFLGEFGFLSFRDPLVEGCFPIFIS